MNLHTLVAAMPKVELHLHLEGSVQPETLLTLADKNGVRLPASTPEGLRDWYHYRDFDHFISIYGIICSCLQTPDDFAQITYEYGQQMARQNIRYAEITWSPTQHVNDRLPFEALLEGVNGGRDRAHRDFGVSMNWIPDIVRCLPDTAMTVAHWLTSPAAQEAGVVAIGLGGPEVGYPPERFEKAFRFARERGLHSNPHAGETVGPESVWGALHALKAERIGHGVRAIEDAALVEHLATNRIPLEVNPTSNVCLGVYADYATHPLPHLLAAGVMVTINSDDPALFNTTLNDEYEHAVVDCGLTLEQLMQVALNAVRASYLESSEKETLLSDFERTYRRLAAAYEGK